MTGANDSMNAPDLVDKDLPLREDTRLLGRVLGDVLRAQILCTQGRHRDVRRIVAELEAANATPAALDTVERACAKEK